MGDLCFAALLAAVGKLRKLLLHWSSPTEVTNIINSALLRVKEVYVNQPREYVAHRSKLRLCKKLGEKDLDPIFRLPRLPKEVMLQLFNMLLLVELPCLVEDRLINEFCDDLENHKVHRQDENSSNGSTVIQPVSSRQSDIQETSAVVQEDDYELYQSFDKTFDE